MSGDADHTSVTTPAGPIESGNDPAWMVIPDIDESDLGRGVNDDERSTGTDETRSGARDHDGGKETRRRRRSAEMQTSQWAAPG